MAIGWGEVGSLNQLCDLSEVKAKMKKIWGDDKTYKNDGLAVWQFAYQIKPGDIVFYTIASECMVPFFRQGFVVVNENRIMAVVNEKLTERRDNLRNGTV